MRGTQGWPALGHFDCTLNNMTPWPLSFPSPGHGGSPILTEAHCRPPTLCYIPPLPQHSLTRVNPKRVFGVGGTAELLHFHTFNTILIPISLSLHLLNFTHPHGDTTLRSFLHSLLQLSRSNPKWAFGVGRARRNYSTSTPTHSHGGTTLKTFHSLLQLSRTNPNGAFGVGMARRNYSTSTPTHPHGGKILRTFLHSLLQLSTFFFWNFSPGLLPFFLILGPTAPPFFNFGPERPGFY